MSSGNYYKIYERGQRRVVTEGEFSSGMMFVNGAVDSPYVKSLVNYDLYNNGTSLIPRAGLRVTDLLLPGGIGNTLYNDYDTSEDIIIYAAKECVESDGNKYRQFILGRAGDDPKLWVVTSKVTDSNLEIPIENELKTYSLGLDLLNADIKYSDCSFLTVSLSSIHGVSLAQDSKVASIVGAFAFGNSFFFIGTEDGVPCIKRTVFDEEAKVYKIEAVEPKEIDPSEAVTYGYNMLRNEDAYSFVNESKAGNIAFTGILPYSAKAGEENKLLMTPKKNEDIVFRCYFKGEVEAKYQFKWAWRNIGDTDWTYIETTPIYTIAQQDTGIVLTSDTSTVESLEIPFKAPTNEIMVRIEAYPVEGTTVDDTIEQAMTVGFDFSSETYGNTNNLDQEVYNLFTSVGMESWQNRLVLWGVPKDPTVLFISDINDPSYFPYPNNVTIFDEAIVSCKAFLDDLLVFTTSQVHLLSLNEDGISFTTKVLQSNLNIDEWDRHLIQVVKNMVFFKSGNYFFMLVPQAQSTTGKLTLAPISSSIVEFFNYFSKNVTELLKDVFDYESDFELVHYYNFLDYEDIHNIYVYKFADEETGKSGYLHLDMLYNTSDRTWRIHTFEAPHFLYPYRQDATQKGTLASTSQLTCMTNDAEFTLDIEEALEYEDDYGFMGYEYDKVTSVLRFFTGDLNYRGDYYYDFTEFGTVRIELSKLSEAGTYLNETLEKVTLDNHCLVFENDNFALKTTIVYNPAIGFSIINKSGENTLYYGSAFKLYFTPVGGEEQLVYEVEESSVYLDTYFPYTFPFNTINVDSKFEVGGINYSIVESYPNSIEGGVFLAEEPDDGRTIRIVVIEPGKYLFQYDREYTRLGPIVILKSGIQKSKQGRCIQLYGFNDMENQDVYIPANSTMIYNAISDSDPTFGYRPLSLSDSIRTTLNHVEDLFTFKNWQFIDTGYRNDALEYNKRYRELQLQLNNMEGCNLTFGLEFVLDGDVRIDSWDYVIDQQLDPTDPNYGQLFLDIVPDMNLKTIEETDLGPATSLWTLDQSVFPELSLWKVRVPISGKGVAPRMRLVSRNAVRYELMGYTWVYRLMNVR